MKMEVKDSYEYLRRSIMDYDLEEKYCGLQQCLMPSGKVLWLCEQHRQQPRVVAVTGSVAINTAAKAKLPKTKCHCGVT